MRIAHLVRRAERIGGLETYVFDLASAQAQRGDQVILADQDGEGSPPPGVELAHIGTGRGRAALQQFAPDLVHVHDRPIGAKEEAALETSYPALFSLHNVSFACSTGEKWYRSGEICVRPHGPGCVASMALRGCAHRLDLRQPLNDYRAVSAQLARLRGAGAIVAYSQYVRSVALANGIAPSACTALTYFVDRPPVLPSPGPDGVVAFAGRLVHRKGLDVLLRALAVIPDAWDELLVAGDGWDRTDMQHLARRLGLESRVRFLGWSRTAEVFAGASVVAVPSRWPEPFGIVGLEAMAAARAVVGTAVGGIPEWLDDGTTGLLVPPSDARQLAGALRELLADPARSRTMGEAGWRAVEAFSSARHLEQLDTIYEGVVA